MIIDKTAIRENNFIQDEYYYDSAREGMFDLLNSMLVEGLIDTLLLPGYIGWSPREGSGIFDPVSKLEGLTKEYYKMNHDLSINFDDLQSRIDKLKGEKFAILIINYFGFVDPNIIEICGFIKQNSGWIIEDNAHGFFTYHNNIRHFSDATFFSLHKMFPLKRGGSILINNNTLRKLKFYGQRINCTEYNPWLYDVKKIANVRIENYITLENIIKNEGDANFFIPLKPNIGEGNIPQTFPICIKRGNRNKIYELMNGDGYGVVSLYHTLIETLRTPEYSESVELSQCIMNLPVHQDVDKDKYGEMVRLLVKYCKMTSE